MADLSDRDAVAATLANVMADHPMWIGDDGQPLDYLPEREGRLWDCAYQAADALAPLLAQARAEAVAAALAPVEQLADEFGAFDSALAEGKETSRG